MSLKNQGGIINIGTYNDNSREYNIDARGRDLAGIIQACEADDIEPANEDAGTNSNIPPDFFRITNRFSEANIRERLKAELSQATSKIDFCRALYRLQHIGCINIDQYASDAQRAKVLNNFQSKYELSASDFCRARQSR